MSRATKENVTSDQKKKVNKEGNQSKDEELFKPISNQTKHKNEKVKGKEDELQFKRVLKTIIHCHPM